MPCRLVNRHKCTRRKYITPFTLCVQRPNGRTANTLRSSHQQTKWKRFSQVGERREESERKKKDLQTAESAEAVLPTPNTKRGHVTMSDAIQLALSGSERQVTRIKYTACHALFVTKALLFSSTRPAHILHHLTQVFGQKYTS